MLFSGHTRREEEEDFLFPSRDTHTPLEKKKRRRKSFTAAGLKNPKNRAKKPPLFSTRRRIVRNETTFAFWRNRIVRTCLVIARFFFVSEGEWMEPGGVVQQRVFFSFIIGREVKRQLFFPFFFLVFVSVCQKRFTQTHKHVLTARLSLFYPLSFVRTENTHTKTGSRHGPSRFRSHGNRTRRS